MGKLVCEVTIGGETLPRVLTTANGVVAAFVKNIPGPGKPFWYWPSVPAGKVVAVDFSNAPIATNNTATNQTLIDGITATPEDVLTYETP